MSVYRTLLSNDFCPPLQSSLFPPLSFCLSILHRSSFYFAFPLFHIISPPLLLFSSSIFFVLLFLPPPPLSVHMSLLITSLPSPLSTPCSSYIYLVPLTLLSIHLSILSLRCIFSLLFLPILRSPLFIPP